MKEIGNKTTEEGSAYPQDRGHERCKAEDESEEHEQELELASTSPHVPSPAHDGRYPGALIPPLTDRMIRCSLPLLLLEPISIPLLSHPPSRDPVFTFKAGVL